MGGARGLCIRSVHTPRTGTRTSMRTTRTHHHAQPPWRLASAQRILDMRRRGVRPRPRTTRAHRKRPVAAAAHGAALDEHARRRARRRRTTRRSRDEPGRRTTAWRWIRAATLATPLESAGADGVIRRAARPAGAFARAAKEAASEPTRGDPRRRATIHARSARSCPPHARAVEAWRAWARQPLDSSRAEGYAPARTAPRARGARVFQVRRRRDGARLAQNARGALPRAEQAAGKSAAQKSGPARAAGRLSERREEAPLRLSEAVEQFQFRDREGGRGGEMMGWAPGGLRCSRSGPPRQARLSRPRAQLNARLTRAPSSGGAVRRARAPPKKRKPRRWLSEDEKVFTCGIDGCARSYGSASSLCAHKRAHHPGWRRREQRRRAEAGRRRGEAAPPPSPEEEEEEEDKDDDESDSVSARGGPRKEGSKALDASARLTPSEAHGLVPSPRTRTRAGALGGPGRGSRRASATRGGPSARRRAFLFHRLAPLGHWEAPRSLGVLGGRRGGDAAAPEHGDRAGGGGGQPARVAGELAGASPGLSAAGRALFPEERWG